MNNKIGVAISTCNRRDVLTEALTHWRKHLPENALLVIVDDASDEPLIADATVVRHDYRRGVAMTKNRGIAELIDRGVEHLFLADDDVWPVADDWWRPYIESPEPHLSFQWATRPPWRRTHDDGKHFAIGFPRGVMLYAERRVIDAVGGMDIAYGVHGGEHVEWQQRIHDAGLTRWPYADVRGSDRLWHSLDKIQGGTTGSTIPLRRRRALVEANGRLWGKTQPGPVPYRASDRQQDWQLGPFIEPTEHYALLRHIAQVNPAGVAVEFGVGSGESTNILAAHALTFGFDSGQGLPEDWRPEFPAGSFAHPIPTVPNARIVEGWFADTLPRFDFGALGHIGIVHFDADLYSSTRTALDQIGPHLQPGTFVVFDEWHGYDGAEDHEQRAWREFADETEIGWTVVGHSHEAWAVRIL